MADADTTIQGTNPAADAKVDPPKVEPAKTDAKAEPAKEAAKTDAKAEPAKGEPKAPREIESDEDPEEALAKDPKAMLKAMPLRKFMNRVARMTKKQLLKAFGTDDFDAIIKEREELKLLREDKEKREREAMTEKEKLEADKKAALERAEAAELRATKAEESRMAERFERTIRSSFADQIKADDVEYALDRLAAHMNRHPEDFPAGRKGKAAVEGWLDGFLKKNPQCAKADATATQETKTDAKTETKVEPKKVPIDTSVNREKPTDKRRASALPEGKTARPNQPNSMSREELRRAGWNW